MNERQAQDRCKNQYEENFQPNHISQIQPILNLKKCYQAFGLMSKVLNILCHTRNL